MTELNHIMTELKPIHISTTTKDGPRRLFSYAHFFFCKPPVRRSIYNILTNHLERTTIMTVFQLQVIAMVTMFCDHIADPYLNNMVLLRCIGRFAFPIYAFLIVEGYRHIKHDKARLEAHLGSYIILAIVSEFCYDLAECQTLDVASLTSSQNCIITLLLGFLGLIAIDKWKYTNKLFMWGTIVLTAMANYLVMSNYKFAGVLLIYAFYFYLNRYEGMNYMQRFGSLLVIFACYIPIYHWARFDFCDLATYMLNLQGAYTWWYLTHILVAALLATYTGKRGLYNKKFKKLYKNFYPGHLFVLGVLRHLVFHI